jgi:hypothetical protein
MQDRGHNHRVVKSHVRGVECDVMADFAPQGNIPFVTTWVVFSGTRAECDVFTSVNGDTRPVNSDAPHFATRLNEWMATWFVEKSTKGNANG